MIEIDLPLATVIASAILASAIIYAARTIASAIERSSPNGIGNRRVPLSVQQVPHSSAGFPVEPSGIPIDPETRLEVGSTVLAFSQGRWWRAEVIALEGEEHVRLHFPGWDSIWDESSPRTALQVDLGGVAEDERPYQSEN
jgi:hypothetical protein